MIRLPIDYFMIIVVGFAIGFASMLVVRPLSPSKELGSFADLREEMAKEESSHSSYKAKSEDENSRKATYEWLMDGNRFAEELEYLMEANCSDHAMRQYGKLLSNLNMSGFDEQTGRLINGDGKVVSSYTMRAAVKTYFALQPLAYMDDEFVPANFTSVVKYVRRKKNWETCEFKLGVYGSKIF